MSAQYIRASDYLPDVAYHVKLAWTFYHQHNAEIAEIVRLCTDLPPTYDIFGGESALLNNVRQHDDTTIRQIHSVFTELRKFCGPDTNNVWPYVVQCAVRPESTHDIFTLLCGNDKE
jgi:hypothetical protein